MKRLNLMVLMLASAVMLCFTSCLNEAADPNSGEGQLPANVATLSEQVAAMKSSVAAIEALSADFSETDGLEEAAAQLEYCATLVKEHIASVEAGMSGVNAAIAAMKLQKEIANVTGALKVEVALFENEEKIQFGSGKEYTIINDYPEDPLMSIYYTTDKTDPVKYNAATGEATIKGILYDGNPLSLTQDTTIKTVYRSSCCTCYSCDNADYLHCTNAIFDEIGTYRYVIKEVVNRGGGGGGSRGGSSAISTARKYTVDVFGNEHPTHIGYIKGYPDGSVRPDGNITREEIAAILYRIKNKAYDEPFATSGEVFPDVKIDRWSVTEIEYMEKHSVVEGYPDGEFKPSGNLTRAEFAAMICRFTGIEDKSGENPFPDLEEEHWAHSYILRLYSNGLISGYEDGTFRPEREITRAEVMTVVNKILGRMNRNICLP